MNKRECVSAVLRTKGQAPYLESVVESALKYIDWIVLVDNNQIPMWDEYAHQNDRIIYSHDARLITPMCTNEHRQYYVNNDHLNKKSLASFYRDAFLLAPKGFVMKLDDDDYWTDYGWKKFMLSVQQNTRESVIYFNGVNILSDVHLSRSTPICGGRDHFILGPGVEYDFRNGEKWEEIIFFSKYRKEFIGVTYYHLKFFSKSPGYEKDYYADNDEYLKELNAKNKVPGTPLDLNFSFFDRFLDFLCPRMLGNGKIGCSELNIFWEATKDERLQLVKDRA